MSVAPALLAGPFEGLEELIQALVVVVFLVVPIVRSVLQSKKKQSERAVQQREARRSLESTGGDQAREREGRSAWDELLRGEAPPAASPAPRAPANAPSFAPSPPAGTAPERPALELARERSAEPRSTEGETVLTAAPSAERPAAELATPHESLEAPESWESMRQAEAPMPEAPGPDFATAILGPLESPLAAAVVEEEREFPGTRLALRATELRRAIVLIEVLSPPLALRRAPAWPSAPLA